MDTLQKKVIIKFMIPKSFTNHIVKQEYIVDKLYRNGRKNSTILSILLVETYFRSSIFRWAELIWWSIFKNENVTIGLAQIKSKHWTEYLKYKHLSIWGTVFSFQHNYDMVEYYLSIKLINTNDLLEVTKNYNGSNRMYYEFLNYAREYISLRVIKYSNTPD